MKSNSELRTLIKDYPLCASWVVDGESFGLHERPTFNFLDDTLKEEKVLAVVIAYNEVQICPIYKTLEKSLDIPIKELKQIVSGLRKAGRLSVVPTFSEHTGLISGTGFWAE